MGLITVVESSRCPGGYAYDFEVGYLFELLAGYFILKILFIKMTIDLSLVRGTPSDSLKDELASHCRGVCMLGPYILQLGPIATKLYTTAFYLVYPLGSDEEAEFCMTFIMEADRYMQRLPKDHEEMKHRVMSIFGSIVGQMPFPTVVDDLQERRDEIYRKARDL